MNNPICWFKVKEATPLNEVMMMVVEKAPDHTSIEVKRDGNDISKKYFTIIVY